MCWENHSYNNHTYTDGLRTLGISWPPFRIFLYNTFAAFTTPPRMLCPNLASWLHKMVFKDCWRLTISHTTRDSSHFHHGKSHRLRVFLGTVKVLYAALFCFSYYIFSEPESYVFGSLISCFVFSLWCLNCYYMWIHMSDYWDAILHQGGSFWQSGCLWHWADFLDQHMPQIFWKIYSFYFTLIPAFFSFWKKNIISNSMLYITLFQKQCPRFHNENMGDKSTKIHWAPSLAEDD